MRKFYLSGTALVAATMLVAGAASAADKKMAKPSLSVGGFFNHEVGGILDRTEETKTMAGGSTTTKNDEVKTSAIDSRTDAEVHFKGSAMLDNGISISARVELEGDTASDQIDETFMTISGSFGQITLGNDDNAADKLLGPTNGSWATNVGSNPFLRGFTWVGNASGLSRYSGLGVDDSNKVTYISPKLGGFSVGMSYIPAYGEEGSNANPDISAVTHDGLAGAIAYSGSFGDVSIGGGVGMRTAQAKDVSGDNDDQSWAVSGKLGFGPLTVAAAYRQQTDPVPSRLNIVDAGARYVQGVNSFSVSGVHSRADKGDAELTIVIASYARSLGAGVKLHTDLIWNDSQSGVGAVLDEDGNPTGAMAQSEKSGTAFVTGIKVSF